ncbi:putative hscarg dehydrogenase [Viridothelium virens]|uniref:Putative hscarg dehydrogenase n=1 Tax=Viridothelium virens TaxID=1048519 RepID=A0A6A6GTW8_VIRVR|nr:putative hscarg dehydrogenase [Viridothelium virens]
MAKLIVVVGVTGAQGSSVAHTFLRLPGWRVRGITRNPSGLVAQALATEGVELIKADLDDKHSLSPAFEDANVIFSNTDFFLPFQNAMGSKEITGGRTIYEYAYDTEVAQGTNIAEAASSPTVLKTLERFIYSSLSEARKWSGGKYKHVYHFDSKAETIRNIQSRFPAVAERMSFVQIGHYVTNWKNFPALAPQKQSDGSFILARPSPPETPVPFVVPHQDTGPFVKALVDLPPGTHLWGVSELMTFPEWAKTWGDTLGHKIEFKQVSDEEFWQGVPEEFKNEISEGFAYADEFGYTGGDPEVQTAAQLGIEIPCTSMAEYIKNEDWSSVV